MGEPDCAADLEERVAAMREPPRCGLLVLTGTAATPEDRQRLERLRELGCQWNLQVLRFQTVDEVQRGRVLSTMCCLVLQGTPNEAEPMHFLGRCISRNPLDHIT